MNLRAGVPMSLVCKGRIAALLFCFLICIACGDVYRPTIIPNPVPTPDPKNLHAAIALNQNTTFNSGTGMQVDVSGDSNAGVTKVAMMPVHAAVQAGCAPSSSCRVWVANSLSDSVSVFSSAGSLGFIGASTDINLPSGYSPVFVHSTETSTMYVANVSSPIATAAPGIVVAIGTGNSVVSASIPVGRNPLAMAETPNGKELYVVNQADNNVTHIHTVDKSVATSIPVGATPSLAYARGDNQRIYVLNQGSGTITTINTIDDTVVGTTAVAAGANFMIYDSHLNRLYVTTSSGSLYVYNAAVDPGSAPPAAPFLMKQILIPGAGDCAQCVPVSVAALPDGTRVYVASAFETTDTTKCVQPIGIPAVNCYLTQVTVVDAVNLTLRTSSATAPNPIPVPNVTSTVLAGVPVYTEANCSSIRFRVSTAAAADSSRVFLATCDAGGIASINTSNDTYVVTLPAPVSAFPPIQTDPNVPAEPPPQNPVFLLTAQ